MRPSRLLAPSSIRRIAAYGCIFLSAFMFWTKPASAIENLRILRGVLIIEGKIEPGDYIKIRSFLSEASNFSKMTGEVFLASQGGNVFEALEIGYLIRHLRLSTDAPSRPPPTERSSGSEVILSYDLADRRHYQCVSACFLLYVAGVYRDFIWAGRLGIHHPIQRKPVGATEKEASIAAVDMRIKLKSYFEEMNVPNKYLDLMYSVPPNEVRWITQSEFNADLKGYIPEVQALLDAKCNSRLGAEQSNETHRCVAQI